MVASSPGRPGRSAPRRLAVILVWFLAAVLTPSSASAIELTATPATAVSAPAVPAEGDGFWFMAGVNATRVGRVVRMAPDTPASVRTLVAEIVRQINDASGAGVLIGPDTTAAPTADEIVVRVPTVTVCGPAAAGCASNAVATAGGFGVVTNAVVEMKRDLLGSGYEAAVLLHEMGHAMGLGHYDDPYGDTMQVMWNSVLPDMTSYRSGDRNGLNALGAAFTNRNVRGTIDVTRTTPGGITVAGWTFDADTPQDQLEVKASIAGGSSVTGLANGYRPDVARVFPEAGPNHGYSVTLPTPTADGSIRICLTVTGHNGQPVMTACRQHLVTHQPFGNIELAKQDGPRAIAISGWAIDPDTADPTQIAVTVDGVRRASATANVARPDVARVYPEYGDRHGFSLLAPDISGGVHTVCVFASDASTANPVGLGCRTVTVRTGDPFGNLEAVGPGGLVPLWISGWTIDPDTPSPVDVHLYIDGRWAQSTEASLPRLDVARVHPGFGADHGFRFSLGGLVAGVHTACAYAINVDGGTSNPLLGCRRFLTPGGDPFGNFEAIVTGPGRATVSGWVIDPDMTDPASVHVYVDGRFGAISLAGGSRPDVAAAYQGYGDRHGFSVTIDNLSRGGHDVCVFGMNVATGSANTLLGCRRGFVP